MQEPAAILLMFVVYPVWVASAFADWLCHRATDIAATSGLKENLLHWLMFAEIGVGMAAAVFLEINAAVLVLLVFVFAVHEATVYWDLDYTTVRRDVAPFEQMVHSFLEMLPLVSIALLVVAAWPQAQALFGKGGEAADWSLRLKPTPLPLSWLAWATGLCVLFNVLPMLQETWSCLHAAKQPGRQAAPPRIDPRP